jgi:putative amino-acid transport system substrate-binding protein
VAFPFAKDEAGEKLRKEFDEELQNLLADGTIKALSEKYYGVDVTEVTE